MSETVVGHLCDLILILKQAKADGGIVSVIAAYDDDEEQIRVECKLTGEAFDRVDTLLGEAYDEYMAHPAAMAIRAGALTFITFEVEQQLTKKGWWR